MTPDQRQQYLELKHNWGLLVAERYRALVDDSSYWQQNYRRFVKDCYYDEGTAKRMSRANARQIKRQSRFKDYGNIRPRFTK
ncbi:MAG: hypothetical protein F6K54_27965 [Okeania sp. SIO3B5]|uniref:hypothetical protein n=1 Tax=Okeania sp. SIO3B5 TaxID=2607811 RepID=UPI0014018E61|nr:hypothetical protein [Okeania sp. SIO3B5]NEO56574.1 hypothetical protein [Okeania sp. SIO3B5]